MPTSMKWAVWYDGKAGGKAGWCHNEDDLVDTFSSADKASKSCWFEGHCLTPAKHYSIRVYTGNVK